MGFNSVFKGLNGLVRFARKKRNLVSARVPSHFKRSLRLFAHHNGICHPKTTMGRSHEDQRIPKATFCIQHHFVSTHLRTSNLGFLNFLLPI